MNLSILVLITTTLLSFSGYSLSQASFDGTYIIKSCSKLESYGSLGTSDLYTEISRSKEIVITHNPEMIILDGDTDYWNMQPKIYLEKQQDNGVGVTIKKSSTSSTSVTSKFVLSSDYGARASKEKIQASIKQVSGNSVQLKIVSKAKSIFSLGFYKKTDEIDCLLEKY